MEYCQSVGKRVKKDCFVRCVNEKINGENKTENGGSIVKYGFFREKLPHFTENGYRTLPKIATALYRKIYRSSPKNIAQFSEKTTAVLRKSYRSLPKKLLQFSEKA